MTFALSGAPRANWQAGAQRVAVGGARAACALLSPLSIDALRRVGALAGDIAFRRNGRGVRTTRTNIDLVYAGQSAAWREDLVRASVRHTAMLAAEATALWTWPLPRLLALTRIETGDGLLRERTRGRAAVMLVPHFGNWEFLGCYLNSIEPVVPLYERPKSPVLDAALVAARQRLGHRSAADSVGGLRLLVQSLRAGALTAVLPDQVPPPGSGVVAPFFGQDAYTMSLVGKLLQRVDAEVLIGAALRVAGGFAIRIARVDDAIRAPCLAESARAMNAAVERLVACSPAQYQWEYKRFRFRRQPNIYR